MKSKVMLICALTLITICLFACSTAPEQVSVEASCDDFGRQQHISKEVEIAVGSSLIVTLGSNATTGFQWSESAQISDQTVLQQIEHKYMAPEAKDDKPPASGTPGQETWTFKALEKGTSVISIEYSRPWEGGEKGVWTFNLSVVVK